MEALKYLGLAIRLGPLLPKIQAVASEVGPVIKLAAKTYKTIKPQLDEILADPDVKQLLEQFISGDIIIGEFNVEWLQEQLNAELKLDPPLKVDGDPGEKTRDAIKLFQKANGLYVDGWAGPVTSAAIRIKQVQRERSQT